MTGPGTCLFSPFFGEKRVKNLSRRLTQESHPVRRFDRRKEKIRVSGLGSGWKEKVPFCVKGKTTLEKTCPEECQDLVIVVGGSSVKSLVTHHCEGVEEEFEVSFLSSCPE